jgi:hypothetical protein
VTTAGRRSKSGIYWCQRPACTAEKQRAHYRQLRSIPDEWAPTICANPACGRELKPRKVRMGDVPGHRWCHNTACRRAKAAFLSGEQIKTDIGQGADLERMLERIHFLHRALISPRVTCGFCGVGDAVEGYRHPDGSGQPCDGVGTTRLVREDAQAVWSDRLGAPEWLMAIAAAEIRAGATMATDD